MKILSVLSVCFATDSWSTAFFVYDQEVCGLREDLLPPWLELRQSETAWSLELGAKKFHEQRTTGPLLFESAPAPPSAGFNVTFEDCFEL